jgi:hypothetical protein
MAEVGDTNGDDGWDVDGDERSGYGSDELISGDGSGGGSGGDEESMPHTRKHQQQRCRRYSTGAEFVRRPVMTPGMGDFQEWWDDTRRRLVRDAQVQCCVVIMSVSSLATSSLLTTFVLWAYSAGWSTEDVYLTYAGAAALTLVLVLTLPPVVNTSLNLVGGTRRLLWMLLGGCCALPLGCVLSGSASTSTSSSRSVTALIFALAVAMAGCVHHNVWLLLRNTCYSFEYRVVYSMARSIEVGAALLGAYLSPSLFALVTRVGRAHSSGLPLGEFAVFTCVALLVRSGVAASLSLRRNMNRRRREPVAPRYSAVVGIACAVHEIDCV